MLFVLYHPILSFWLLFVALCIVTFGAINSLTYMIGKIKCMVKTIYLKVMNFITIGE